MSSSSLTDGKIIVTGGAGFIGSAIVWALNQRGIENILVSDYLDKSQKFKNLTALRFDDYIEADVLLNKINNQASSLDDIKYVFHLGACSSTTELDARYLIQNNYEYTKSISNWTLNHTNARFIYASSAATYGDGTNGMIDSEEIIDDLRPLNMYAYSKQLFDLYAKKNRFLNKIVGIKYFNIFGPNEYHKDDMRSVVNKAFHQIKSNGSVQLFKSYNSEYNDGEQMRDFLYVKDAVNMTLYLAEEANANGLYNLGSGDARTWKDLVIPIFETVGMKTNIEFIDMPESLKLKYQYYTCANISKIKKLGYKCEITPLNNAVSDYVKNYLMKDKYLDV